MHGDGHASGIRLTRTQRRLLGLQLVVLVLPPTLLVCCLGAYAVVFTLMFAVIGISFLIEGNYAGGAADATAVAVVALFTLAAIFGTLALVLLWRAGFGALNGRPPTLVRHHLRRALVVGVPALAATVSLAAFAGMDGWVAAALACFCVGLPLLVPVLYLFHLSAVPPGSGTANGSG